MKNQYKVMFIGSTKRGFEVLNHLISNNITKFDSIISMRQFEHEIENYEEKIKSLGIENKVNFHETNSLQKDETIKFIQKNKPDLIIACGLRHMIPDNILRNF